jgi:malonate-semialdehyde dehydrogenase (acetylating)/methylmalonate-semialdehyde dehydrogenase
VQANLGAKNHGIIMPDANKNYTLNSLVGAAFGAAGQRCMALSTVVFVGKAKEWLPELVERSKKLSISEGSVDGTDVGPLISCDAKERVEGLIQSGVDEGASLLLDGRGVSVDGYEKGNFVGPSILSKVTTDMKCYKEEVYASRLDNSLVSDRFLSVLKQRHWMMPSNSSMETFTVTEPQSSQTLAPSLVNVSPFLTTVVTEEIDVGQVGINVPIPVPLVLFHL